MRIQEYEIQEYEIFVGTDLEIVGFIDVLCIFKQNRCWNVAILVDDTKSRFNIRFFWETHLQYFNGNDIKFIGKSNDYYVFYKVELC